MEILVLPNLGQIFRMVFRKGLDQEVVAMVFWGELDNTSDSQKEALEEWVDRQIVNAVSRLDSTDSRRFTR